MAGKSVRAVFVLFDSLNRRYLPIYGNDWVLAPNFERLAARATVFENSYGGSMPCIPARRELHTGRTNFLHRGWGPLEPFDDSVPMMLRERGVYTHLVTDHQHYFEPGGTNYHTGYRTWEFFRGQEGDAWKAQVADPTIPASIPPGKANRWRQDWVNRSYLQNEADFSQTRVFDASVEFLHTNASEDRWFLQIDCFDPHEPFHVPERFRELYAEPYDGPHFDWPRYARSIEDDASRRHVQRLYAALVTMCDYSLGRVLDAFDNLALWDDTMLIVGTDHGFMLGERGWWAKNIQPWFNDIIHTPLVIWDPRTPSAAGARRRALVQTVDLAPTLLDLFDVDSTGDMEGQPLTATIRDDEPAREAGLFGSFGGHVNITDGRYVYMRAPVSLDNAPLHEYTLMPMRMDNFMGEELRTMTLAPPFPFTKQLPVLKVPGGALTSSAAFGSLLFDLDDDPGQERPIVDSVVELQLAQAMVELMRLNDAPHEQFERLGLPADGAVTKSHLVIEKQKARATTAFVELPARAELRRVTELVDCPLRDLAGSEPFRAVLDEVCPEVISPRVVEALGDLPFFEVAAMIPSHFTATTLTALATKLAEIAP